MIGSLGGNVEWGRGHRDCKGIVGFVGFVDKAGG